MMRKGQVQGVKRGDCLRQAIFIAELFGVAISTQQQNGEALCFRGFSLVFCNTAIFPTYGCYQYGGGACALDVVHKHEPRRTVLKRRYICQKRS
jgi:hypothetical protein